MIIGVCGQAGSGKDTAADFLVKNHGFVKVAFADPMKRICRDVFDFTDEQLWGPSEHRNAPDMRYERYRAESINEAIARDIDQQVLGLKDRGPRFLTPRYALQQLGSEWGRDCFKDAWVQYALRVAKQILSDPYIMYTAKEGIVERVEQLPQGEWERSDAPKGKIAGVVISDVRFRNEVEAIQAAGGKVYRMMRGQGLEGAAGQHGSETEQASLPLSTFDGVIDNREWTLEQLEENMRGLATTWPIT